MIGAPEGADAATVTGTRTRTDAPAAMEAVVRPAPGMLIQVVPPSVLYCSVPAVPGPVTVAAPGREIFVGLFPMLATVKSKLITSPGRTPVAGLVSMTAAGKGGGAAPPAPPPDTPVCVRTGAWARGLW